MYPAALSSRLPMPPPCAAPKGLICPISPPCSRQTILCAGRATVIRDNRPDHPMATLAVFGHMLTQVQQQALYAGINPATPDFHADYFHKAVAAGLGPQAGTATCKVV